MRKRREREREETIPLVAGVEVDEAETEVLELREVGVDERASYVTDVAAHLVGRVQDDIFLFLFIIKIRKRRKRGEKRGQGRKGGKEKGRKHTAFSSMRVSVKIEFSPHWMNPSSLAMLADRSWNL